jgi:hypothetical protein
LILAYAQPSDARALVLVAPLMSQIRGFPGGSSARQFGTLSLDHYRTVKTPLATAGGF